jgi:hypothetical protein
MENASVPEPVSATYQALKWPLAHQVVEVMMSISPYDPKATVFAIIPLNAGLVRLIWSDPAVLISKLGFRKTWENEGTGIRRMKKR